ncbi:MAG: N-formylglutamate amidohydrolase [Myxococcota bacterium]
MGFDPRQVVVSCEHASNRVPPEMDAPPDLMALHIAWDVGALQVATRLARSLQAPLHKGEYSRLLVDLNRGEESSRLIRRVSDGHPIPFNRGLTPDEADRRIRLFHRPYRRAIEADVKRIVERRGRCVHLAIHSFTPALQGKVRGNDLGLLYDPHRHPEVDLVREMRDLLAERTGMVVWLNRPYSGTADGIQPPLRARYAPERFVGIELEMNQRHASDERALEKIADSFGASLELLAWPPV